MSSTRASRARETRTGRNVRNSVIDLVLGGHDTSLSTGEFLMEYHHPDADLDESIGAYVDDVRRSDWKVYGEIEDAEVFPSWFDRLQGVASREAEDADEVLREEFQSLTESARTVFDRNN